MATTSHLEITLLEQSQAQKEITINEALARIDAVLNTGVVDRDLASPPGSPAEGDAYIVAASPTGAWSGKAGQVAYYDQIWRFIAPREGLTLWVNDENIHVVHNGTGWQTTGGGGGGGSGDSGFATVVEGRLTLTSGTAVTTSDVTAATTLYFTPHRGNRVALYNGSAWELLSFSEISLAVPATTNTVYDVWAYNNSGSVALEATAWSNDTTRATALALQDGTYVKSGSPTRRYVGSFRTTGTSGRTEDSQLKRYVWNYYQRTKRRLLVADASTTHTYSSGGFRAFNNDANNKVEFLLGVSEDVVEADWRCTCINSTSTFRSVGIGIGLDSYSTAEASSYSRFQISNISAVGALSMWRGNVTAGAHYLSALQTAAGADTQTWYSNGGIPGSAYLTAGLWG